ncbi:MAG: hypothetical protein JJU34_19175 [Lunatimonas sp.]|uniref:hypothetical protein n=1 Tax=Lunatimonas sp. TaxID=2060141 RepID=UPI00263B50A9|nr:hypothetical protein [Lunatimonas sp.]MCC5939409.1 hypothetical protein [Lunatimonas sp.]
MKKKMTLKKVTLAAGVVAMSVGLFNTFTSEANSGSDVSCYNEYNEGTTHITFCNGCVERTASTYRNQGNCTP